jgi:hypothetical protein
LQVSLKRSLVTSWLHYAYKRGVFVWNERPQPDSFGPYT